MSIRNVEGLRRHRNMWSTQRDREGVRINVRDHVRRRTIRPRERRRAFRPRRNRTSTTEGSLIRRRDNILLGWTRPRPRQRYAGRNVGLNLSLAVDLPNAVRPVNRNRTTRARSARARASYTQRGAGPSGDSRCPNRNARTRRLNHRRWLQPNNLRNEWQETTIPTKDSVRILTFNMEQAFIIVCAGIIETAPCVAKIFREYVKHDGLDDLSR